MILTLEKIKKLNNEEIYDLINNTKQIDNGQEDLNNSIKMSFN